MSNFDPYHKWLGIPPAEQPPHHYRLLSVPPFEADLEVIEAAADRQMTYVRQCATGPYMKESQQLLNELSAARVCLLNSAKKKAYDGELKGRLAPAKSPEPAVSRPRVTRIPAKQQPDVDTGDDDEYSMIVREWPVLERPTGRGNLSLPPRRGRSKKNARPQPYLIWGGAAGLGLLLLWGLVHIVSGPGVAVNQPAANGLATSTPAEPAPAAAKKPPPVAAKEPPAVAASEPHPAPADESGPNKPTPDVSSAPPLRPVPLREIVELVLKLKGRIAVSVDDSPNWMNIQRIEDLPAGGIKLSFVNLAQATVEELRTICSIPIGLLTLEGKNFTDEYLIALTQAKGINGLGLYNTACTDAGLGLLAKCPALRVFYFDNRSFTAEGWRHLLQISELREIQAVNSSCSDAHIASLAGHTGLKSIFVGSCTITGEGFSAFRGKPQLESLKFAACPLSAEGLRAIAEGLPELKTLSLQYVVLTEDGLEQMSKLRKLDSLEVIDAQMTDAGLVFVGRLGSLTHLNLAGNPLTGEGLGRLKDLRSLKRLLLPKDRFSATALDELRTALPKCAIGVQ